MQICLLVSEISYIVNANPDPESGSGSGSSPKFNGVVLGPRSTTGENFVKIRPVVSEKSRPQTDTHTHTHTDRQINK